MASVTFNEASSARGARLRYVTTIFAGSFLLFLIQPMIARMALPRLGGAPAVWNSAMLVYQALLLGGYAYAHWLGRFAVRTQAWIHLGGFLVAALMLPIGLIAAAPPADANIFLWVPWLLLVSIGPLFLIVSAQAPLLQRWFDASGGGDPYPLYAASNLGSFAGLIAYPLLVEPYFPIVSQSVGWSLGYAALIGLVICCAVMLPGRAADAAPRVRAEAPPRRVVGLWILLAAIPSGLMLAVTLHLTTDIVAMPLIWVIPLGLYLLSFSVAFAERRGIARFFVAIAPATLLVAAGGVFNASPFLPLAFALAAVVNLFAVSVALHSALFDRRPPSEQLTNFYLAMSVGGVIGGIFCALVAPMLFDWTYEYPILMLAAALVVGGVTPIEPFARLWRRAVFADRLNRWAIPVLLLLSLAATGLLGVPPSRSVTFGAALMLAVAAVAALGNRLLFALSLGALMLVLGGWDKLSLSVAPGKMTRSFFGIYSIAGGANDSRYLLHGTTIHGVQNRGSVARERMATTYYVPPSGVGMALSAVPSLYGPSARIAVVGLGTGTLACYARPGQRWTFYEIDPVIADIARNPSQFTFLARCLPDVPIVIGDARLSLAQRPGNAADVLVVDAFSSDSVPIHLLTREAFATYRRHLSPRGLLLVHVSNRYLDLEPVVAAAARNDWTARVRKYRPDSSGEKQQESISVWILLSPSKAVIDQVVAANPQLSTTALTPRPGFAPWTDQHASILSVLGSTTDGNAE
jgi:hypothetical protein